MTVFYLSYPCFFVQIQLNLTDSVLSSNQQNIFVNDYFLDFFIKEWSTKIDYMKYFQKCAPSSCTYNVVEQTNVTYAITLFISLYGGLVIVLRLIARFLVNSWFKRRRRLRNMNDTDGICYI